MIWRDELLDQLDFYWDHQFMPRLRGLTDEECFWEPVADCWSVRTGADGAPVIDWQWPVPDPPPVTTIAWRIAHIAVPIFGVRASQHFGDGSLAFTSERWPAPATADQAFSQLTEHHRAWRDGLLSLDEDRLRAPVGEAEGPWAQSPMATLVLHLNREVMHHGAEIALLRDLYRAGFTGS